MLKSIRLKNYKGFKDTGNIEFKPITVIFGKNSSGKSSICKLLPILRDGLRNYKKPFPLISKEGVRIAYRYEDLFKDRLFTDSIELQMMFRNGLFLTLNYVSKLGNLFNLSTGLCPPVKFRETNDSLAQATFRCRYVVENGEEASMSNEFISAASTLMDGRFENELKKEAFDVNFIGPIRAQAPRIISKSDYGVEAVRDSQGLYAYYELMRSKLEDSEILNHVSKWFKENMDGYEIDMEEIAQNITTGFVPYVRVKNLMLNMCDVGEGITQVLPIIVQSFLKEPNSISILEQPALHLHPAKHAEVAKRLAESAKQTGQKFVIESHSHNLLLGFQRMVANAENDFSKDDIVVYFIDQDEDGAYVKKITIDENGTLSDWPAGVFEEGFELTKQIIDRK